MNWGAFVAQALIEFFSELFSPQRRAKRSARKAERKRRRRARRRRAHNGDSDIGEFLEDEEGDLEMIPQNTMRKSGVGLMALAPLLTVALSMLGIGECTPQAIEEGCKTAADLSGSLLGAIGGIVYVIGSVRADRRTAKAAAAQPPQP